MYRLIMIFAFVLAGCSHNSAKPESVAQESVAVVQEQASEPSPQSEQISATKELHDYLNALSNAQTKDRKAVEAKYGKYIEDFKVSSYAKGLDVEIEGRRDISQKRFNELGKFTANVIRKNRGIKGKIGVYYDFNGKLKHGRF